ncbi:MAG: PhzF family phenazine biosynthesis protein [Chloroflexi bacterium]|nr:MAG: PhzF family phenazine biosynthesis protein [Chloroflexota bacterium]
MAVHRFKQVDVFTARPFFGNPVAVVLDADDIADEEMQRIAAWTNLSETTFVLKPTITQPAYRLRIFTPAHELPFAGHPTIGSCHAVIEGGIVTPKDGRLVQECGAGNLPLRIEGAGAQRRNWVEAPEAKLMGEHPELSSTLSDVLGSPIAESPAPTAFRNGPTWLFVRFETEPAVAALKPDISALAKLSPAVTGVAAFAFVNGEQFAVHIRCSRRQLVCRRTRSRAAPTRLCRRISSTTASWKKRAASTSRRRRQRWAAMAASTSASSTTLVARRSAARR